MIRKFFLLFVFNTLCAIVSPSILAATDNVVLTGVSNAGVTKTVVIEPEVINEPEMDADSISYTEPEVSAWSEPYVEPATYIESATYVEPVAYVEPAAPHAGGALSDVISIAGRTLDIVDVDSTLVDSGDHVNHYDQKFYYGHNSSSVFGEIVNLGAGDTFSITRGGVTTNYRVATTVIYEKNQSSGLLQLNGEGDYMWYVAKARIGKTRYDVSLMTCYGRLLGGGDATHRFVIFANAI